MRPGEAAEAQLPDWIVQCTVVQDVYAGERKREAAEAEAGATLHDNVRRRPSLPLKSFSCASLLKKFSNSATDCTLSLVLLIKGELKTGASLCAVHFTRDIELLVQVLENCWRM